MLKVEPVRLAKTTVPRECVDVLVSRCLAGIQKLVQGKIPLLEPNLGAQWVGSGQGQLPSYYPGPVELSEPMLIEKKVRPHSFGTVCLASSNIWSCHSSLGSWTWKLVEVGRPCGVGIERMGSVFEAVRL